MTGTGLTRYQQLPYPTSQRVRGNGASDIEALAVKTDSQLDRIGAAWSSIVRPNSAIFLLSGTVTGNAANQDLWITSFSPASATWGANPPSVSGVGGGNVPDRWGWYEISVSVSSTPAGTVTANSRRLLALNVLDDTGSSTPSIQYLQEDFETGSGEVINQINVVTLLNRFYSVQVHFLHTNTGSTLNFTTTATSISYTKIRNGG